MVRSRVWGEREAEKKEGGENRKRERTSCRVGERKREKELVMGQRHRESDRVGTRKTDKKGTRIEERKR